jgi:hypothetical protein
MIRPTHRQWLTGMAILSTVVNLVSLVMLLVERQWLFIWVPSIALLSLPLTSHFAAQWQKLHDQRMEEQRLDVETATLRKERYALDVQMAHEMLNKIKAADGLMLEGQFGDTHGPVN